MSNSAGRPEPVTETEDDAPLKEKTGGEKHSAKAHRCVDKVRAKGHPESNSWAICTASIGKRGVYAKGHGGNANPKKKVARDA